MKIQTADINRCAVYEALDDLTIILGTVGAPTLIVLFSASSVTAEADHGTRCNRVRHNLEDRTELTTA